MGAHEEDFMVEASEANTAKKEADHGMAQAQFNEMYGQNDDIDGGAVMLAGLPEGTMSPQYYKPGTTVLGDYDIATGDRIIDREEIDPPSDNFLASYLGLEDEWDTAKLIADYSIGAVTDPKPMPKADGTKAVGGKVPLMMSPDDTLRAARMGLAAVDDVYTNTMNMVADVTEYFGAKDQPRKEKHYKPFNDPGRTVAREVMGFAGQYAGGLKLLKEGIGVAKTAKGAFAQSTGAAALASATLDPQTDSLTDTVSKLFNMESSFVNAINPAMLYADNPMMARISMAVEGAVGAVVATGVVHGGVQVANFIKRLSRSADDLEIVGMERMRKSSYNINSGADPEAVRGMTEWLTAKVLKGADKLTPDLRKQLASMGASDEQMTKAFGDAMLVTDNAAIRAQKETTDRQMQKINESVPGFGEAAKYLKPEEIEVINKGQAEKFMKMWGSLDQQDMMATALAGKAKKGWYLDSMQAIESIFGPMDGPRFAAFLSALSPQNSVEGNLKNAVNAWTAWSEAGRPQDSATILRIMAENVEGSGLEKSVMDAWRNNSYRALTAEDPKNILLSGPKVQSFYRNLIGDYDEVTNDAWMANYAGVDQKDFDSVSRVANKDEYSNVGTKGGGYMGITAKTRSVAQELTEITGEKWYPAEVQETIWSYAKTIFELRSSKGYTGAKTQDLVGEVTDEMIGDTPDFGTLLTGDEYAGKLRGAGYGSGVDEFNKGAAERQATEASKAVGGSTTEPNDLRGVTSRLERLYADRSIPKITRDARKTIANKPDVHGYVSGPFTRGTGPTRTDGLKGVEYTVDEKLGSRLEHLGAANPSWVELEKGSESTFFNAITAGKGQHKAGAQVYIYDQAEYKNMKTYLTPDGGAGFAIKENGDLVSVFSDGTHKKITASMLTMAVQQGARRLAAFDTHLMAIYTDAGFKPVARAKWIQKYMPEGWDKEFFKLFNKGEPDIVYMVYDPKFNGKYTKKQSYVMSPAGGSQAQNRALNKTTKKKKGGK